MTTMLQQNGQMWTVSMGDERVAEIYLDYFDQVDEVVLCAEVAESSQLSVLQLTMSHVMQFAKNRRTPHLGHLLVMYIRNDDLTTEDSYRLMDFGCIPKDVLLLDRETIIERLHSIGVSVIYAIYKTADEAIAAALAEVGLPSLRYRPLLRYRMSENEVQIRFSVSKPKQFILWKHEWLHHDEGLHIIPSYHPVLNKQESIGMINGDTDAYIRGVAIESISCPRAAQANRHGRGFSSSWTSVKHPFYAVGRSLDMKISSTKIRSKEGVWELVEVLRAALGQGERYVDVSGGFRAPLRCAHNRLRELGIRSPYPYAQSGSSGHLARGSEEHCVWAYRTLEAEGKLATAHVPTWFVAEGWLQIYDGAEVGPTLF